MKYHELKPNAQYKARRGYRKGWRVTHPKEKLSDLETHKLCFSDTCINYTSKGETEINQAHALKEFFRNKRRTMENIVAPKTREARSRKYYFIYGNRELIITHDDLGDDQALTLFADTYDSGETFKLCE